VPVDRATLFVPFKRSLKLTVTDYSILAVVRLHVLINREYFMGVKWFTVALVGQHEGSERGWQTDIRSSRPNAAVLRRVGSRPITTADRQLSTTLLRITSTRWWDLPPSQAPSHSHAITWTGLEC